MSDRLDNLLDNLENAYHLMMILTFFSLIGWKNSLGIIIGAPLGWFLFVFTYGHGATFGSQTVYYWILGGMVGVALSFHFLAFIFGSGGRKASQEDDDDFDFTLSW